MVRTRLIPGLLAALAGLPCAGQTTPVYTDIGIIPGGNFSYLYGVSSDGKVGYDHYYSYVRDDSDPRRRV